MEDQENTELIESSTQLSHGSLEGAADSHVDEVPSQVRSHAGRVRSCHLPFCNATLGVSVLLGLVSGSLYGFGRYALDLRDTLHMSQIQVQRYGILMDTGSYVGHPLTGLVYDLMGPSISCFLAAAVVFCSYGSIHLEVNAVKEPNTWIIGMGFFGVGVGSGLGYIAGLGSTTNMFSDGSNLLGRTVGLVAASYGLSSTMVELSYRQVGLSSFFLVWAILVAVVNVLGAAVFRPRTDLAEDPHSDVDDLQPAEQNDDVEASVSVANPNASNDLNERLLGSEELDDDDDTSTSLSDSEWTSWKRMDYWMLLLSFACFTGCGLFVINNVSTMVQSIRETDSVAGSLVILLSISNVAGRVVMGCLSDHPKFHKLDLLMLISLLMALGLTISAFRGSAWNLALTVGLVAFAYGGSWVLIVGILADTYGRAHFGKDYGLMVSGPAISGLIFNSASARFYEEHAAEKGGPCVGEVCYRRSFLMTAIAALAGCLVLSKLPNRSRPIVE